MGESETFFGVVLFGGSGAGSVVGVMRGIAAGVGAGGGGGGGGGGGCVGLGVLLKMMVTLISIGGSSFILLMST